MAPDSEAHGTRVRVDHPLGVALVGYGLAGAAFHAPVIMATDGLHLAAIVTRDPGRRDAAHVQWPHARVVPDAAEAFALDGMDVAVVATPNRTHVPLALMALEAGLHVVVEKPLAATADDARRLIEEARRRDRLLTVYHNRRWDGDFLTLRSLIAAGKLGDVLRFESRFERWRPTPKPGWRQNPDPAAAGGLLYDLGVHLIDQALLLFGPVRHVHAELDRRRPGVQVTDDAFLALHHESGVRSHLWMNAVSAAPGPRFRVLGSRATWIKSGTDPQEAVLRAGGDPSAPGFGEESERAWGMLHDGTAVHRTPTTPGRYPAFYAALRKALRRGGPAPVDPECAVAVLDVIAAAYGAGAVDGRASDGGQTALDFE